MIETNAKQLETTVPPLFLWGVTVVAPILAGGIIYLAAIMNDKILAIALVAVSFVIFLFWLESVLKRRSSVEKSDETLVIKQHYEADFLPAVLCSHDGRIVWRNAEAAKIDSSHQTVSEYFQLILPNARSAVSRIAQQAGIRRSFTEKLSGVGGNVEIQARLLTKHHLWRFRIQTCETSPSQAEEAMLTVARNGTVLFMNPAARVLIGSRVTSLDRLFATKTPLSGQAQSLQTSSGKIDVLVDVRHLTAERSHVFLRPVSQRQSNDVASLEDLPIPLLFLTEKGVINDANNAALTLLGYSNLHRKKVSDVFESNGITIGEWILEASEAKTSINAEFLRVKGAKKETFVQVALKSVEQSSGASLVAVLTDATKLKSLEAQFVQSQKMQAIGQLAGGVAHDFNNLLTAISGHCDLMLLRHDPGDQGYSDLMQIHQNANRAAGLVSQLLAFSRKQTLQLEKLDLRNTLSDLTHLLNRLVGETVTLTLTHDPALRAVRADKRQLEQVIMNLVVNARDAMPQGGEIKIQTEDQTLTEPLKRDRVTVPAGDYIIVRVSDGGVGIDEDALQKIFEPFYTTKRVGEGTGLGLSTAYGIVKQTGGFIFADSEVGQGTCFWLLFPACEKTGFHEKKSIDQCMPKATELCSGVVLLVEDEAPVRAFASRALSMCGLDVVEADSAEAALTLLEDESLQIDIFVTDVVMPGMDGPTWVQKAMKQRPNVNVVFISGYAEGAFKGQSPLLSKSVFLPKPFSLAELTSTVQSQLSV